jgi:uncharacterized protein DUF6519
MKGDFTRDTFYLAKHFSRVLMQQGRVTLDADHNEQVAIDLHNLRTLARDVIGPFAAPAGADGGFLLESDANGAFTISKGRFYVDGILVENDTDDCTYKNQPDYYPPTNDPLLKTPEANVEQRFFVYLDVWERHITAIEDPAIREVALGGPDTCTRAKIIWQVKALPLTPDLQKKVSAAEQATRTQIDELLTQKAQLEKQFQAASSTDTQAQIDILKELQPVDDQLARLTRLSLLPVHETLLSQLVRISSASLAARVNPGIKTEDACVTPPASKYRGAENQLYRVEVHRGGKVSDKTPPTFKWSRDNGSVATAWLGGEASGIQVANARGFAVGNWVELSDDTLDLLGQPGAPVQLVKVDGNILSVDPATTLPPLSDFPRNPRVRQWDYVANDAISLADDHAIPIRESPANATPEQIVWIDLEDGVQIQFSAGGEYRTGDYWLIPARVATGNIEWPQDNKSNPKSLPPRGIAHHYALIGVVARAGASANVVDMRCEFQPLFVCIAKPNVVHGLHGEMAPTVPKKPRKARKRQAKKGSASPS